jgi:hypothetical protein
MGQYINKVFRLQYKPTNSNGGANCLFKELMVDSNFVIMSIWDAPGGEVFIFISKHCISFSPN